MGRYICHPKKTNGGKIDFLVHAIAFAGKDQLAGRFIDCTTREGFKAALDIFRL